MLLVSPQGKPCLEIKSRPSSSSSRHSRPVQVASQLSIRHRRGAAVAAAASDAAAAAVSHRATSSSSSRRDVTRGACRRAQNRDRSPGGGRGVRLPAEWGTLWPEQRHGVARLLCGTVNFASSNLLDNIKNRLSVALFSFPFILSLNDVKNRQPLVIVDVSWLSCRTCPCCPSRWVSWRRPRRAPTSPNWYGSATGAGGPSTGTPTPSRPGGPSTSCHGRTWRRWAARRASSWRTLTTRRSWSSALPQ